ncbi:MAG: hypothetical protein K5662_06200 [Lachnospiraceae bacterium]|nr:hypothetical protein [Lachnospiraceae bacterium]
MKISKKEIHLLLMVLGLAIVGAVYMFVVRPYKADTAQLKKDNEVLKEQAELYKTVNLKRQDYVDGKRAFEEEKSDLIIAFPLEVHEEDMIMFYSNLPKQLNRKVAIHNLGFLEGGEVLPEGVVQLQTDDTADSAEESSGGFDSSVSSQIHLFVSPITMTYSCTNEGFKDLIRSITSQKDKKSIKRLVASADSSTGLITGEIDVAMYYMYGTGKNYVMSAIPKAVSGNQNLFHTLGNTVDIGNTTLVTNNDTNGEEDADTDNAE